MELISNSSFVGPSVASTVGAQIKNSPTSPSLSLSSIPICANGIVCSGTAGTYFSLGGSGLTNNDKYALYQQDVSGNVSSPSLASSFIASNATVPPNTWQDTPACGVAPRTLVFFAQDINSNSLVTSNAVTEQVITGTCIAPNPAPSITSLLPPSLTVGSAAQALTIKGTGFLGALAPSNVTFNGVSRAVSFNNANQLTISLTASDLATQGTYPVVVTNPVPGGGASQPVTFNVTNATSISIYPASKAVREGGTQTFTATVSNGSGVNWSVQEGPSGGTITSVGNYTAPNTTGTFHVIASATTAAVAQSATVVVTTPPQDLNEWTWVAGSKTTNAVAVYGTQGVAAATNDPGNRDYPTVWTDNDGSLWLFGGCSAASQTSACFNDLWSFNTTANQWTWISGTNVPNALGVYGTQGVAALSNIPGARTRAASWVDTNGNFWLFDGIGYGSGGPADWLDDLWEFNPTTRQWTSIAGPTIASYGTMGVSAASNHPEIRTEELSWVDSKGKFWLFGGGNRLHYSSGGEFNDLWQYDPVVKQWTWMGGSNTQDAKGSYGTQGVTAPSNYPGARSYFAGSVDPDGNVWIFGGFGYDSAGNVGNLNDLWQLNTATMQWTWMSGSNVVNAAGIIGTKGVAAPANVPGSRNAAVGWNDSSDNFWLFSGDGFNDLWKFNLTIKQWAWMGGFNSNPGGTLGVYGTQGVAAATNTPGPRSQEGNSTDKTGAFWLFGGVGLNDLWRYQP
ncbi:MAG: hypothetical protein M3O31_05595 [Acidobacteriota bacterium]|nr:hypothetical protein [Acidobacteriota bacterium]